MRQIVKCISTIDQFDVALFNRLNLGVEIQDFSEPNLSPDERADLAERYSKLLIDFAGIVSLHGPYLDLKPASPDPLIRAVSHNRYLDALQTATQLNADYLIFHSQINPFLDEPRLRDLNNLQTGEFWNKITGETDYRGTILIENIFEKTPDMLKRYIQTAARPGMKINLDIGHLRARRADLEEWIRELKDYIAYIHVHSNDGNHDLHLPPGQEEITDLYRLLDKYRIEPVLALEYSCDNERIADEVVRYLR